MKTAELVDGLAGRKGGVTNMKANQWVIVVLTAAVAVLATLLVTGRYPVAPPAYAQDAVVGSYVIALIGPELNQRIPILLVDTREMSIICYEYTRGSGQLELQRVRNYRYDRQLIDFWAAGEKTGRAHPGYSVEDVTKILAKQRHAP